jgi:methionyl-tRNA formyltransferase
LIRVGFAGTPRFAATALDAILRAGFPLALVLTRPDRPRGRGLKVLPSPVKALAAERGVPLLEPPTLKTADARAAVVEVPLDVLVVAAYGLLLPPEILAWPVHGCINIHASLLPRWRGAAPVERAIIAGDAETGITLMHMDAGLDTGPVIERVSVAITPADTTGSLTSRLAETGAAAIVGALARLRDGGRLEASPQPESGVTYAPKIGNADAAIDWNLPASVLERRIRALDPAPGATATLDGAPVKLWRADVEASAPPGGRAGAVLATDATGIVVACGEGALRVIELQPAGGRRMSAAAFVAGRRLAPGAAFDVNQA